MTNTITRSVNHPDTGAYLEILMSDEEIAPLLSNDPVQQAQGKQTIRDKVTALNAAEAAKQTDLDEIRGGKVTTALAGITTDIGVIDTDVASVNTATAAQVRDMLARSLAREKKALLREQALIKALTRLVG